MKELTVNQLAKLCVEQIKKGNGSKSIVISDDDEGNGFHGLFCGFTDSKADLEAYQSMGMFHDDIDIDNTVILG